MEFKQLSDHSAHTYEKLTENAGLEALESQLQEVKQQEETIQVQLKPLSVVERMKDPRSSALPNSRFTPFRSKSWK
jgi:hypothetical protein